MHKGSSSQPLFETRQTTLPSTQLPSEPSGFQLLVLTSSCGQAPPQILELPSGGVVSGDGQVLLPTCHEKLSSTSCLSRSIGGSQYIVHCWLLSRRGSQSSAAIAKGDLHAGQSGSRNHLAIPKPLTSGIRENLGNKEFIYVWGTAFSPPIMFTPLS